MMGKAYRYFRSFEDIFRHVALRHLLLNRLLDISDELLVEFVAGSHEQEQHHAFVIILRSSLADADRICDLVGKVALDDGIYLCRPKAHAAGVQDAVCAAEEGQVLGNGVIYAEVSMCPDVIVAGEI